MDRLDVQDVGVEEDQDLGIGGLDPPRQRPRLAPRPPGGRPGSPWLRLAPPPPPCRRDEPSSTTITRPTPAAARAARTTPATVGSSSRAGMTTSKSGTVRMVAPPRWHSIWRGRSSLSDTPCSCLQWRHSSEKRRRRQRRAEAVQFGRDMVREGMSMFTRSCDLLTGLLPATSHCP